MWYSHAHDIYLRYGLSFGIWQYGSDKWGNWSLLFSMNFWRVLLEKLLDKHFAWFGFPVFVAGLFIKRKEEQEKVFDVWLLSVVVYFLIVAEGNYAHEYYQLPLMIPAVVFMGKIFSVYFVKPYLKTKSSLLLAVCFAGMIGLGTVRYYSYLRQENENSYDLQLAGTIQNYVPPKALLFLIGPTNDPTVLYLAHRKGWVTNPVELQKSMTDNSDQPPRYILGHDRPFANQPWQDQLNAIVSPPYRILHDDGRSFLIIVRKRPNKAPQQSSSTSPQTY